MVAAFTKPVLYARCQHEWGCFWQLPRTWYLLLSYSSLHMFACSPLWGLPLRGGSGCEPEGALLKPPEFWKSRKGLPDQEACIGSAAAGACWLGFCIGKARVRQQQQHQQQQQQQQAMGRRLAGAGAATLWAAGPALP